MSGWTGDLLKFIIFSYFWVNFVDMTIIINKNTSKREFLKLLASISQLPSPNF